MMKKNITITLFFSEIVNDIENKTWRKGKSLDTGDNTEAVSNTVFDIEEDNNKDRATRVLDTAFEECIDMCYPYTKVAVSDNTSLDNELQEHEQYVMNLQVPEDFSETTAKLLKQHVHDYLVCSVMEDWAQTTMPDSQAYWLAKKEECGEKIRTSLNYRVGRVRRPLTPF